MFQLIWVVPVMVVALYIFSSIKILSEYERGVIFRLGRVLLRHGARALLLCSHRRPDGQDVTQGRGNGSARPRRDHSGQCNG